MSGHKDQAHLDDSTSRVNAQPIWSKAQADVWKRMLGGANLLLIGPSGGGKTLLVDSYFSRKQMQHNQSLELAAVAESKKEQKQYTEHMNRPILYFNLESESWFHRMMTTMSKVERSERSEDIIAPPQILILSNWSRQEIEACKGVYKELQKHCISIVELPTWTLPSSSSSSSPSSS